MASSTPPAATSLGSTCATSGPQTQTGSNLISGPMLPQITGASLPISTPAEVTATSQINPHGIVTTTASLHLDLAAVASSILETRVKPGVVAAGYPTLAPTAWDVLDLDRLAVTFPLPSGTAAHGTPTASSSTSGATAAFGPDGVTLTVAHVEADTRSPAAAATFTVSWEVADGGEPPPRQLLLHPGAITYDAHVDVGLLFYGVPVVGGITGSWACTPDAPDAVLATTDVVSAPVSTESSTTAAPSTLPPTTVASSSTTSTTWPSAPRTPPGSCAVSGFDRDGGYLGVDLGATGYFHTARYGGRWWLVTPEGHPFWSQGINHVAFDGTPDQYGVAAYRDAVTAKYGTKAAWATAQVSRMRAWGYNTLGAWSDVDLFGAAGAVRAAARPHERGLRHGGHGGPLGAGLVEPRRRRHGDGRGGPPRRPAPPRVLARQRAPLGSRLAPGAPPRRVPGTPRLGTGQAGAARLAPRPVPRPSLPSRPTSPPTPPTGRRSRSPPT